MRARIVGSPYCDVIPGAEGEVTHEFPNGYGVRITGRWTDAFHRPTDAPRVRFFRTAEVEILCTAIVPYLATVANCTNPVDTIATTLPAHYIIQQ